MSVVYEQLNSTPVEKAKTLMEYLHMGYSKVIEGRCYEMTEDFVLYMLSYSTEKDDFVRDEKGIVGLPDLSFTGFVKLAEKLTEGEIFMMKSEMVLSKMKKRSIRLN